MVGNTCGTTVKAILESNPELRAALKLQSSPGQFVRTLLSSSPEFRSAFAITGIAGYGPDGGETEPESTPSQCECPESGLCTPASKIHESCLDENILSTERSEFTAGEIGQSTPDRRLDLQSQQNSQSAMVAEPSEPARAATADGPFEPNSFRYGGEVLTQIRAIPFRLLKALWNAQGRTRSYDESLATEVWCDANQLISRQLVDCHQKHLNAGFRRIGIHLHIRVEKDKVLIKQLSESEFESFKNKSRRSTKKPRRH